jgi:membrane protein
MATHDEPAATGTVERRDYRPEGTDARTSLFATLKRTALEFGEDKMTIWAAALTYYGLLSLFPALIALVSILGLFGDPQKTTQTLTDIVTQLGPSSAANTFEGPIKSITSSRGSAGILFFVGLAGALWSASGYVGAFTNAASVIYETPEGRPFWKLKPLQIFVTLLMIILLALLAIGIVMTGPVVDAVAKPLGIGSTAQTVWNIAKWPVMLVVVMLMIAVLYHFTPNVKLPGFKWVTPGAIVAVVVWIVASALFALYVSQFGSYNKTYGSLAGVVIVLIRLWITNVAILFGHELNAELERSHQFQEGVPGAERELQLQPRDEPDRPRTA